MCPYVLVPCCDVHYELRVRTMIGSSLPPVVCRKNHALCTLFVCVSYNGVILCCVFVLSVFVLCFVYPVLPVSLDCTFLIAPLVFSISIKDS